VKHPTAYRERLEENLSPIMDSEILTNEERESERVMLEIRMPKGIAKSSLSEQSISNLESFLTGGQLSSSEWDQGQVALTISGRLMADRIVREILM
jgi:oxygen-independent coproporphyrinogen-3 oxidase